MKHPQRIISHLICLCFFLLSGCQTQSGNVSGLSGEVTEPIAAVGKFVETKMDFPNLVSLDAFDYVGDNTYYAMGVERNADNTWEQEVWCSTDGCETWEKQSPKWLEELGAESISAATFTTEGDAYVFLTQVDTGIEPMQPVTRLTYGDSNGLKDLGRETNPSVSHAVLTDAGDLLVSHRGELEQRNLNTGTKRIYPIYSGLEGSFTAFDSTLAIAADDNSIVLYDLITGKETGKLPCKAAYDSGRLIAVQNGRSGFLHCDRSGIYRMTMDGSMTEKLATGRGNAFEDETLGAIDFYQRSDGALLLLMYNGTTYQMIKYAFDASASITTANMELVIYSLYDNESLRVAMSSFRKMQPNTPLDYQVGIPDGSAVLPSDAIGALNTDLLAGKGPDVIQLDGLPVSSYQKKGVLLDISDQVNTLIDSHQVLPGVVGIFGGNDGIFAVPTRFTLPVISGLDIGGIQNAESLVTWLEQHPNKAMATNEDDLLDPFYTICSPGWFGQNNTLNADTLKKDLAAIKHYYDLQEGIEFDGSHEIRIMDQALWWSGDRLAAMFGNLNAIDDAAYVYSVLQSKGGSMQGFPCGDGILCLPQSILGVNANNANMDAATQFVVTALSEEAQTITRDDGLPVNYGAIGSILNSQPPGNTALRLRKNDSTTGELYETTFLWYSEDRKQEIIRLMETAKTPAYNNEIIRQLVIEETLQFFSDNKTLEDTVDSLTQKLQHYFAEM